MKIMLVLCTLLCAASLPAWDINQYGPTGSDLICASMDRGITVFGGKVESTYGIFLEEGGQWAYHPIWMNLFPIRAVYPQSANIIMGAFGDGSYSDGIYNYDVSANTWTLNDWFFRPNFIFWHPEGQKYYAGERDGLYRSVSGNGWNRVPSLPMDQCDCFAAWGDHAVTDIGNSVYYSVDAGQTWNESSMGNLNGFRFSPDGTVYAALDNGSDSDGLWRSDDFGASWYVIFYSVGLKHIGPQIGSALTLGWRIPNEQGNYVAIYTPQGGLEQLDHPSLNSPVRQIDTFPLVNTPSVFVLNTSGCHFITGFTSPANDPVDVPQMPDTSLQISPNPTRDSFEAVASKALSDPRAAIYDLRGRKIAALENVEVADGKLRCTLPDLRPGIYLLKVEDHGFVYKARLSVVH